MTTRTQLLRDPNSGARPLFAQDASRVIAHAIKAQSLTEPDPLPRWQNAALANLRTDYCQRARIRAFDGDHQGASEYLAKAQELETGWNCTVRFTAAYVAEAAAGAAWAASEKWTAWHLPSMYGVPEHVLDATYERRSKRLVTTS